MGEDSYSASVAQCYVGSMLYLRREGVWSKLLSFEDERQAVFS
jgi:hypothetical protein